MEHTELLGLSAFLVLGVLAQWTAARLRVPSILTLLLCGFVVGPISQLVIGRKLLDPEHLFGPLMLPAVSLAVAIILFEGGMTLNLREVWNKAGIAVVGLVTLGAAATWIIASTAAYHLLDMPLQLAWLLGAILVVTGPTVIGPMLRHIRPIGKAGAILKWEGIVIDPIGATLALLMFEAIRAGAYHSGYVVTMAAGRTLAIGLVAGSAGAWLLVLFMRRLWIPDHLQNPVTLMFVVAAYTVSNLLQSESGLLTVTVLGIVLANQRTVQVQHIIEFKESLASLLIAGVFVVLSSWLDLEQFGGLGWSITLFVIAVILVSRPVAVYLSTVFSGLSWAERAFIAGMAPRGIVAAAVASIFAFRLQEAAVPGADQLVPVTFSVVIATVVVYSIAAPWLAAQLHLTRRGRMGIAIAGAGLFARALAQAMEKDGHHVLLVDTNYANVSAARMAGIPVEHDSILSESLHARLASSHLDCLLAMTPNDEVNLLASAHLRHDFGRSNVMQLATAENVRSRSSTADVSRRLIGRRLFAPDATFAKLEQRMRAGAVIKKLKLTKEFPLERFRTQYGSRATILLIANEEGKWQVNTADQSISLAAGMTLVCLVDPDPTSAQKADSHGDAAG